MIPNESEIAEYLHNNPQVGRRKLANRFSLTEAQSRKMIKKYKVGSKEIVSRRKQSKTLRGIIPAQVFIDRYDVAKIVRDALSQLDGGVISDTDFRTSLGVNVTDWARVRELDEFSEHIKSVKGKMYWASPEVFKKLQKVMDIL